MLTSTNHVERRPDVDYSSVDDVLAHYQADLYRFAVHLTRDRAEASNLHQETLLKAFHAFDSPDKSANYRSWLFTIATDAFLSDQRRYGPTSSPSKEQAAEVGGTILLAIDRLGGHTLRRELEACVAALPTQQWATLVQRKYFGLEYAEIGAILGCSEAVARARVHGALRVLRACIGDQL